jgi:two-component system, chemotaxis family, chemotaxis protein CheY
VSLPKQKWKDQEMKARILLVDDSGLARRTLRQILANAGHTVDEAKDGMEALERYALHKPDLVLLDMVMEGMRGIEVLTKLRQFDAAARVVLATADIQESTRTEAQAAGAVGMIPKPFQADRVLQTVEAVASGGMAWN